MKQLKQVFKRGQLRQEFEVENGKKNGVFRRWHPNGQLHIDAIYQNGKPVKYLSYNEEGELYRDNEALQPITQAEINSFVDSLVLLL